MYCSLIFLSSPSEQACSNKTSSSFPPFSSFFPSPSFLSSSFFYPFFFSSSTAAAAIAQLRCPQHRPESRIQQHFPPQLRHRVFCDIQGGAAIRRPGS